MIHEDGIDANESFYRLGLTSNKKIGSSEGAIGMLTKGRVSRKDYNYSIYSNGFDSFRK